MQRALQLALLFSFLPLTLCAGERIAPDADRVVRQLSDYYAGLKSLSVEVEDTTSVLATGREQKTPMTCTVAMRRPNLISASVKSDRFAATLVSDGKNVYCHVPQMKKYSVNAAPDSIDKVLDGAGAAGQQLLLFVDCLLRAKPYDHIMIGVAEATYVAAEELEGVKCHHLAFTQEGFDWEMWVDVGEKPLVRKVVTDLTRMFVRGDTGLPAKGVKAVKTTLLKNWAPNADLPDERFKFTPPADAQEVNSLFAEKAKDIGGEPAEEATQEEPIKEAEVAAKKPIPAGPGAYTAKKFRESLLKWNRRTSVECYEKVGRRDPKWDKDALRFLEMVSRFFSQVPDAPELQQMLDATKPLVESGCNDPLVLYCIGRLHQLNNDLPKAEDFIRRSIQGYQEVKYPRIRACWAPDRLSEICQMLGGAKVREVREWQSLFLEWIGEAAREGSIQPGEERIFWTLMGFDLYGRHTLKIKKVYTAIAAQPGADPWIVNLLAGIYHDVVASQARGSGWASKVPEENLKTMWEHAALARKHYVKAWQLHPEYPEPATAMIRLVMMTGGELGETPRLWFDRAVAAQFDFMEAYDRMQLSLIPRWGGSHRECYAFGLECLATKRFDTQVPLAFYFSLINIQGDGEMGYWKRDDVYANLKTLFEGLLNEPSRVNELAWHKSRYAAVAWRCGKYADARKLFEELGDQLDPKVFQPFAVDPALAKSEAYAMTCPEAEQIKQAEELYTSGKPAEALEGFEKALKCTSDKAALLYIRDRAAVVRVEQALLGDQWVSLMPPEGLLGWQRLTGSWTLQEGSLVTGAHEPYGPTILHRSRAGTNLEFRGEVEFDPKYPPVEATILVGYETAGFTSYTTIVLDRRASEVSVRDSSFSGKLAKRAANLKDRNSFLVQFWGTRINVLVNGEPVLMNQEINEPQHISPSSQVGLGAHYRGATDVPVRFRNVEIRRLKSPPEGLGTQKQ